MNIQNLLNELVLYTNTGDSPISREAKSVLRILRNEFEKLQRGTEADKQKKMITLFLGGVILALAQDEMKYHDKLGALEITQEVWKNIEPSSEPGEAGILANIYHIGNHILIKLPDSLSSDIFDREIKFPFGGTKPFFPELSANKNRINLLLKFCEKNTANLEDTYYLPGQHAIRFLLTLNNRNTKASEATVPTETNGVSLG
ncbi:hypothetical protein BN59_02786 [Legionella massiliensis]|uniref:Uncharacterized protein n=1 Tax=Legionella massiliensis TaxID=1034943 RepID=A0A078L033_9GAMM|nr:hypothetical protein [Legionella massiliensis]CDZ78476.1 hypothetical protein BN59_02786 [Legionella massiliensis]CEE14214.1 hypothetical protein BN1094_02786 [Legionella massiliensis]